MNIILERTYDFVPEWNDNLKEEKPVTFHMRLLTTLERDKLMDFTSDDKGKIETKFDRPGMFTTTVVGIDNLMVNGETVKDARGVLNNPALYQLYIEMVGNIISRNTRIDLKNS